MVAVQHGRHRSDLIGEQTQIEFGIAMLDHATQKAGRVDAPGGPVDGCAITAHLLLMTGRTFVLSQQLLTQAQIGPLENGGLLGLRASQHGETQEEKQELVTHGYKVIQSCSCEQAKTPMDLAHCRLSVCHTSSTHHV